MGAIGIDIAPVRIAHEGHSRAVVHEVAKTLFTLAQADLGSFPFRDVLDGAQESYHASFLGVCHGNGRKANPADFSRLGYDAHFVDIAVPGEKAFLPAVVAPIVRMNQTLPTPRLLEFG